MIGTSFWPAAEKISQARYVLICCIAAVTFGVVWYDYATLILPTWQSSIRLVLVGGCLLALGLALRQRTVGILAALAGLAIFISLARFGMPTDPHAYRRQYEALMRARERVETIRNGGYVRFWYDQHDPDVLDFDALSSTYLWSLSLWGTPLSHSPTWTFAPRRRRAAGHCFRRPFLQPGPRLRIGAYDSLELLGTLWHACHTCGERCHGVWFPSLHHGTAEGGG